MTAVSATPAAAGGAAPRLPLFDGLDPRAMAPVFARHGRLHVPDVLPAPAAAELARRLDSETPWRRAFRANSGPISMPLPIYEAQPAEWRTAVDAELRNLAGRSFRYLYDHFPVSDELEDGRRAGLACEAVWDAMNAPAGLDFLRALTGDARIGYCDAQVTRFRAGDFLTQHDDDVAGKHRLYAYVLNMTPEWKADWGGVLMFLDEDGHVAEGYTPAMNALNIFRVPMEHAVSEVASYAPAARVSITGWIRSRR